MSEQEFELYLRLMSRLLKLSQAQERAISDELRDHMEERFTELVRAGLPREKAIERALMEFGDAASLAQEFSALAARRRRRFWRMSLAGTSLAVLLAVGLVSMWPIGRLQNAPRQDLVAQETARPTDGPAPAEPILRVRAVDPARVLPAELNVPVEFDLPDNSLKEVFYYLSEAQNIPVVSDRRAFDDASLNPEELRISLACKAPLSIALDQVCEAAHRHGTLIDWSYRDQVLRFTTSEVQADQRFVQSYDASRLVGHGIRVAALPSLLARASSSLWEPEEPGTSNINPIGTQLVINAGARQHREIAALLAALDAIFQGDSDVIWSDETAQTLQAEKVLDRTFEFEFPDNTLKEVVDYITQVTEQPIQFDYPALQDEGINPEEAKVSFRLAGRSLRTALELLLSDVGGTKLVVVPRLGSLWVTTAGRASEYRTTAVYRVAEFEQAGVMSELISTIQATTGPWERDEPGTGSLQQPHPDLFVIRQTAAVHRQIQKLIEEQRRTLPVISPEERAALNEKVLTRLYRLTGEKEEDMINMIRATIEPASWGANGDPKAPYWIRSVRVDGQTAPLPGGGGGGFGGGAGFGGGGGGFLQIGGGPGPEQQLVCQPVKSTVLLVRHTRATHRRIDSLLHAIRTTASSHPLATGTALLDPVISYGVEVELP